MTKRKIVYIAIIISFLILLSTPYKQNSVVNKAVSINYSNIQDNKIEDFQKKYNNQDIQGIISIDNTSINEPVLKHTDNNYYLSHNIYNEKNKYGSIFFDYRTDLATSKKILIFGHNFENGDYSIVPFKELENYYNNDYYLNHEYINLTLKNEVRTYQIFSVYVETSDFDYMHMDYKSTDEWYNHLLKLKSKSLYNTNVNITNSDNIVILQTCSYNSQYKNYPKKYLLVIGKEIKKNSF